MGRRLPAPAASMPRSKVIRPSVRVPVLSVKRISMLPRSSMATSRLTRTFFAARAFDPAERLTVTMAGIISGAMPTAMASENSRASMSGRERATLTMKMNAVSTAATPNRNLEKRDRPTSNAVWPCARPGRPRSGRRRCERPSDHHPERRPLVDDRPHEGAARLVLRQTPGDGRDGLDHRHRLAGEHAFVALALVDVKQTQVGRHQGPDAKRHHVAWHQIRHGHPSPPVPADLGLLPDLGPKGRHRELRPVFVEEAEADAEGDDDGDDHRVGATAGEPRNQRRAEQEDQDWVPNLAKENRSGMHTVHGECIRAEPTESFLHLVGCEPFGSTPEDGEDLVRR